MEIIKEEKTQRIKNIINCFIHFLRNYFPAKGKDEITYVFFFVSDVGDNKDDYKDLISVLEDELKRHPEIKYRNSPNKDEKGDIIIMMPFEGFIDQIYISQVDYCKPGGKIFVYTEKSFTSFPIRDDDPEYELLESYHEGEGKDFIQSRIYSRRERKTEGF